MSTRTRIEHDLLGEREVPAEAYYGIHTVRALENFPVSGLRPHPELIRALAEVKRAAAQANRKAGLLEPEKAQAIVAACDEIRAGALHEWFVVDPFQGGAGTSTNMNANEVIANRAIEMLGGKKGGYDLIHPNDHVNMSQSTNDVYPTAVRVAALRLLQPLVQGMSDLQGALQAKEAEFAGVLKIGRTETQDAVPVTLGQEFAAWAQAVQRDWWRLWKVEERLRQVNLGGTAVGTGLNADRRYVHSVVEYLAEATGLGLARAENMMDVTQNCDVFVEVSGLLKAAAVNLAKLAADLRLLSSGPRAGIGEIHLPELQAGSSIMPGKVNPVMTEMATQVAYQVMAADLAITLAAQAGQLELNAFLPQIAWNLFLQLDLLRSAIELMRERCIQGITADEARCAELLERSFGQVTALAPHIGYQAASEVAREAYTTGRPVREIVLARGLLTTEELAVVLSPFEMTKPGIAGEKVMKARNQVPPAQGQGSQ